MRAPTMTMTMRMPSKTRRQTRWGRPRARGGAGGFFPDVFAAVLAGVFAGVSACAAPSTSPAEGGPGAATEKVSVPAATTPGSAPSPTGAPEASAAPTASAAPAASTAPTGTPEAPSAAPAEAPIPNVKVVNIGMHIGGGKNDAPEKAPIKQSVEPHFDSLKRCFALAEDQTKGGDFGIDLRIEGAGGKAKVSHPRTAIKGEAFETCMVKAFEAIEFLKPKGGVATMVSYSVRFTPQDR